MPDIDDIDDDDIPASAFTGEAPARPEKERKGGNMPTGPQCPECKTDEKGRIVSTWVNSTHRGYPYFRCSRCGDCWWPMREDAKRIDKDSKWPPFNPSEEKQS